MRSARRIALPIWADSILAESIIRFGTETVIPNGMDVEDPCTSGMELSSRNERMFWVANVIKAIAMDTTEWK
jgi:hypothetical protein